MTGHFKILDTLRTEIKSYAFINSVTHGLGDSIDLQKQTIFPLSHIMITDATPNNNIVTFNVSIWFLDVVDINKDGENNLDYVHNNMYNVALRLYESLRRGNLWDDGLEVVNANFNAIERAYENYLAGWQMDVSIMVPNHMSIC